MKSKAKPAYLNICIAYRIITLAISSIVYIVASIYAEKTGYSKIVSGMCISCFISSWLYKKIGNCELWLRILFTIEVIAYSIFIFLSGGFYSPYLWYEIGCIVTMIALEKYTFITILSLCWCLLWASLGMPKEKFYYEELNIFIGIFTVIGCFYVLRFYIRYMDEQKKLLVTLNANIRSEKEKSEHILHQLTNIYETFNLFSMTDPDKILKELTSLLNRSIAPSGCILLKFNCNGQLEQSNILDVPEEVAENLINSVIMEKNKIDITDTNTPKQIVLYENNIPYEVNFIGKNLCFGGVFIREFSNINVDDKYFYLKLMEIILENLNTHSQIEKFIAIEEQNRIANEIHDTVIQKLFSLACSIKIFDSTLETSTVEDTRLYMYSLKKSIENTMGELRESIYGRNFKDTINTFTNAITAYMKEVELFSGASINLNIDPAADCMTTTQKIAIYRVSCEAVNNAVRHGNAKKLAVNLMLSSDTILLSISDNGSGFSGNQNDFLEGNGLNNMRNIATILKGNLSINSMAGQGTEIKLNLPR